MISAAGILFIAAGLGISIASLNVASEAQNVASAAFEESKKATQAQTIFAIQKFGFGVLNELGGDRSFIKYLYYGPQGLSDEERQIATQSYLLLLTGYNVIFSQRRLGYIEDSEWELFKTELCGVVTSKGGQDYFGVRAVEETTFDEPFKQQVQACIDATQTAEGTTNNP